MPLLHAVKSRGWPAPDDSSRKPILLLLHGYGSNEHDLAGLAPMLPGGLPWASPRAPLEMGYGAAAWFPLVDLESEPSEQAVSFATDALWAWIDATVPERSPLIPVGFSQGGFMALQLLRSRPQRIAGTVVLAGFATARPQPKDAELAALRPPVLWARGDADQVVAGPLVHRTEAWMATHVEALTHVYPGLAHGINEQMMIDVCAYVDDAVARLEHE